MGEFDWLEEAAEKIRDKEYEVAKRNKGKIPHSAEHGIFDDCSGTEKIGTRTNGFYGGIQWQLYNATREPLFLENALSIEKKLDAVLMDSQAMDDSSGILFMPTAVADFHMTGSRPARNRALLAANNLAGRFNPNGNFIRAFNDPDAGENTRPKENCAGTSHVRTLMSLPLLYWASEVTKDPRFRAIAVKHGLMANGLIRTKTKMQWIMAAGRLVTMHRSMPVLLKKQSAIVHVYPDSRLWRSMDLQSVFSIPERQIF